MEKMHIIPMKPLRHFRIQHTLDPILTIGTLFAVLIIGWFVVAPLLQVIVYPRLQDYLAYFSRARWLQATWHSLVMTLLTTLSTTLCGFLFAYGMVRLKIIGAKWWRTLAILPILSPPFIVAISYIMLFGNRGFITFHLLGLHLDVYGWRGLWLVQTVTFFPYAYLVIYNVLNAISPNLEWAAANLGAKGWNVFWKVVWPLARPGVAGAALLVAISALADFGNPIIIAGNFSLLPSEAYMQIVGWYSLPAAAVLAMVLIVPTALLYIIQQYWVGRKVYVTVTGKSSSLRRPSPSSVERWFFNGFIWCFGGVILLIYGTLFWGSFSKIWGVDWSLTLANYAEVWSHADQILNSIFFSIFAAFLCALFSMAAAYIGKRQYRGIRLFMDAMATLPGAIPGIFIGIGYILAFNKPPLILTGSSLIIILAFIFWNLPMGYRNGIAALQQVDESIERAALNLGANYLQTFGKVILPLLKPAFTATFTIAFLRSVTNLSITAFLVSAKTVVGTVSILSLVDNGAWSQAAALTTVLIGISLFVLFISQRLFGLKGETLFSNELD
jgi:iron(III) transport system permease protein